MLDPIQDAVLFFSTVFDASDIVEVRYLPSGKSEWKRASEFDASVCEALTLCTENAYAGMNARRAFNLRGDDNVVCSRVVFADFDGMDVVEAEKRIEAASLPYPSMLNCSGGGVHAIWCIGESRDLVLWRRVQRGIAAACGADIKCCNPERILRIPGTVNRKEGREAKRCYTVHRRQQTYKLEDFPVEAEGVSSTGVSLPPGTNTIDKVRKQLSRATLLFLATGAGEGERNAALFAAACDMAGLGIAQGDADRELTRAAEMSGLKPNEIASAIRSAYSKSRTAAKPMRLDDDQFLERVGMAKTGEKEPATGAETYEGWSGGEEDDNQPAAAFDRPTTDRVLFSNTIQRSAEGPKGKQITIMEYRDPGQIMEHMLRVTSGWPKVVGGKMFVTVDTPADFGPQSRVSFIDNEAHFFAWLHGVADVSWASGDAKVTKPGTKEIMSPITKGEYYRYCLDNLPGRYQDVSQYPHHKPMTGTYYLPCTLPAATGKDLDEFVAMLNAATREDRGLLMALTMTPGWGGPAGARPAFMLEAQQCGSGKTVTAMAIGNIWGGAYMVSDPNVSWDQMSKNWMSSDKAASRTIIFDNQRGKIEGTGIESLITAEFVSGWAVYRGLMVRPNTVTVMLTMNGGRANEDMASRFVVVHMGVPKTGSAWQSKMSKFIRERRWNVVADVMATLQGPDRCEVHSTDRFPDWQYGVLAKLDDGEALAKYIQDNRIRINSDGDRREEMRAVLANNYARWDGLTGRRGDAPGLVWVAPVELYCAMVDGGAWSEERLQRDVMPAGSKVQYMMRVVRQLLAKEGVFVEAPPRLVTPKIPEGWRFGQAGRGKGVLLDLRGVRANLDMAPLPEQHLPEDMSEELL